MNPKGSMATIFKARVVFIAHHPFIHTLYADSAKDSIQGLRKSSTPIHFVLSGKIGKTGGTMTITEMVYLVLALIVILLVILTITAIASVLRNRKKKSTGQLQTYTANSARAVDPQPKLGGAQEVQIVENGRSGSIVYFEKGQTLKLYWELGGADAFVTIWAPSEEK
jgi:hypothetical protein